MIQDEYEQEFQDAIILLVLLLKSQRHSASATMHAVLVAPDTLGIQISVFMLTRRLEVAIVPERLGSFPLGRQQRTSTKDILVSFGFYYSIFEYYHSRSEVILRANKLVVTPEE